MRKRRERGRGEGKGREGGGEEAVFCRVWDCTFSLVCILIAALLLVVTSLWGICSMHMPLRVRVRGCLLPVMWQGRAS